MDGATLTTDEVLEKLEMVQKLRRERCVLRMQSFFDKYSNKDGMWNKAQAVKFLLGCYLKNDIEPDFQVIDH